MEEDDEFECESECLSFKFNSAIQHESTSTFQPEIGPGAVNRSHGVSRSAGSFL